MSKKKKSKEEGKKLIELMKKANKQIEKDLDNYSPFFRRW